MTSMRSAQNITLIAATITTGLIAGLFFAFACAVMPALRGADDRAFVDVMQRINVTIVNPVFMLVFVGGLALSVAAGIVHWRGDGRSALAWIIAGLVLYAAAFLVTTAINVPLNDKLGAAGDVSRMGDVGAVRHQFEGSWVAWNIVRTVTTIAAFCCLAYALFVHARSTAPNTPEAMRARTEVVALPPPTGHERHAMSEGSHHGASE
jgi:uncharacterized membrane protein